MFEVDPQNPTVTLLVRSMNRDTLAATLASIAAQDYPALAVVVVNASGRPHRALPELSAPNRLVEPGRALQRAAAANAALEALESPLAMFVDDDDLIDAHHVSRLVAALQAEPSAPAAYAGVRLQGRDEEDESTLDEPWSAALLRVRNPLPIHSVLFRRQVVQEYNCRFDDNFEQLEDWDFWLQLSTHGDFVHCPGVSATYRLAMGSSGLSAERNLQTFAAARKSIYAKWLPRTELATLGEAIALLSDREEQAEWDKRQLHVSEARLQQRDHETRGQLLELREHYERLQALHAELHEKHGAVWERLDALQREKDELQTKHDAAQENLHALQREKQTQLDELENRQRALQTELQALEKHRAGYEQHCHNLREQLTTLLNSRSMKLTAPLRWLANGVRRLRDASRGTPKAPASEPQWPVARAKQQKPQGPVDVIVPVYKGLDETRDCLESVWASTPQTPYRLVVINDQSPEPEVTAWLREAAKTRPMLLLENEKNLGFVGTVNRGMALSSNADVVLLNSDAEVANDWLDRLVKAAYVRSERPVSSVTPFSNNATICSYPRFCEDNELPPGYDLPSLDRLFAEANPGQAVDVPTGIGFCMYIRRDSLDDVGLFDEANFGKGYGEENDFCMRAMKAGWRHVHALDVFCWHKGSVSFGASQNERVRNALEVLDKLHPEYAGLVHHYLQQDPARPARQVVDIARLRRSEKPRILLINHQRGGGTERHCFELSSYLGSRAEWLMLKPAMEGRVELSWYRETETFALSYMLPEEFDPLVAMLKALGVSRVHVHHWLGLDASIMRLAEAIDVPQDVTLHDYYAVCPQISLTQGDSRYCGELGVEQCRDCLKRFPAPDGSTIEAWRERYGAWLKGSARVFAPSEDAAQRFENYFPDLNVEAHPHPDSEVILYPTPHWQSPGAGPLRVAIIGALSGIKGADLLEAVAKEANRRGLAVEFKLFGYAYRALNKLPTLSVTGPYKESELPALVDEWQPHIAWFPALWPETYSYTLSACMEMGLPIVATNLGAFEERLCDRPLSWVLDWRTTPEQWCDWFGQLPTMAADPFVAHQKADETLNKCAGQTLFYRNNYLIPIKTISSEELSPLPPDWQLQLVPTTCSNSRVRHTVINALYWLRSRPLLRPIVRRIPPSQQRRLKSLILREH